MVEIGSIEEKLQRKGTKLRGTGRMAELADLRGTRANVDQREEQKEDIIANLVEPFLKADRVESKVRNPDHSLGHFTNSTLSNKLQSF